MRAFGGILFFGGLALIGVVAASLYGQLVVQLPLNGNAELMLSALVVIVGGLPVAGAVIMAGGMIVEAIETEGKATRALLGEKPIKGDTIL